jgi:hypothetical protein
MKIGMWGSQLVIMMIIVFWDMTPWNLVKFADISEERQ